MANVKMVLLKEELIFLLFQNVSLASSKEGISLLKNLFRSCLSSLLQQDFSCQHAIKNCSIFFRQYTVSKFDLLVMAFLRAFPRPGFVKTNFFFKDFLSIN